jgi:hypothetical protein
MPHIKIKLFDLNGDNTNNRTAPNTDNKGKLFVTFFAGRRVQKMHHSAPIKIIYDRKVTETVRKHNLPLLPGRYA